jgi:hypothetical protein
VLGEQFWFCSIDDPSTLHGVVDRFGPDHVLLEVDYPHADSTWPDTQALLADRLAGLPPEERRLVRSANAAALFRHPPPPECP